MSGSKNSTQRLRIVVLGSIVRLPMGGLAWHYLQYVRGLMQLGHEAWFLEDSDDVEWSCYDPSRHVNDTDPTYGLSFAADAFEKTGLKDRWAYFDAHSGTWYGLCGTRMMEICASSDLLINLGLTNPLRDWSARIPVRALIDTDPIFDQIRHLENAAERERARQHTNFFSFGENLQKRSPGIPDDGFAWQPTRQPIVLDAWPVTPSPEHGAFTTVMQWDSYPASNYAGRHYGMKSDSFSPYVDLPTQTNETLEIALGGPSAPRELLRSRGWRLCNPLEVAADPWLYQGYIRRSKGELTVAKHGYVVSRCGWFSERSAAYLASGRPVITEETGFSEHIATGSGLLSFSKPEEARAAIEDVSRRYEFHCKAARTVAEEYFDARRVLDNLLERCNTTPSQPADGTATESPVTA